MLQKQQAANEIDVSGFLTIHEEGKQETPIDLRELVAPSFEEMRRSNSFKLIIRNLAHVRDDDNDLTVPENLKEILEVMPGETDTLMPTATMTPAHALDQQGNNTPVPFVKRHARKSEGLANQSLAAQYWTWLQRI